MSSKKKINEGMQYCRRKYTTYGTDDALREIFNSLMEKTENTYFCVFLKLFCWWECKLIYLPWK